MKFSYQYKTSGNEKRDGVIAASSKDEVYRKLKADGIHPFNVTLASGLINKMQSFGKRGLAIVLLALATVGLAVALGRARTPAAPSVAQTSDRHQIYGDPAIMEEMVASGFANVFAHPGERYLAYFAQPGREVSVPAALSRLIAQGAILSACLTNEITVAADDPREVKELKQIVNGMKDELRAYIEEGSAADYVRELRDRQREERMIYRRVLNELGDSRDPALVAERNKSLRELGLPTIRFPIDTRLGNVIE